MHSTGCWLKLKLEESKLRVRYQIGDAEHPAREGFLLAQGLGLTTVQEAFERYLPGSEDPANRGIQDG